MTLLWTPFNMEIPPHNPHFPSHYGHLQDLYTNCNETDLFFLLKRRLKMWKVQPTMLKTRLKVLETWLLRHAFNPSIVEKNRDTICICKTVHTANIAFSPYYHWFLLISTSIEVGFLPQKYALPFSSFNRCFLLSSVSTDFFHRFMDSFPYHPDNPLHIFFV